jgi:hypothetical protein
MIMDPRTWVDQLFTYGPYAVLALFVLWVAPAQLKAFRQTPHADSTQRAVSGLIAIGCWLIVFLMVGYIYLHWPPRKVYLGSLGVHPPQTHFYSQTPQLFLSLQPADATGRRVRWDYVIVTDAHEDVDEFRFSYEWGPTTDELSDFILPLSLLKKRRVDLHADHEHPETLLYSEGDPATPKPLPRALAARSPARTTAHAALIGTAHAEARTRLDKAVIIEWLASSDGNLRSQARVQLRQLSPDELRQMLQTPGLTAAARQQIDAELRGRR